MDEMNRCYHCMELKPERLHICPHCSYDETSPYDANYAPPGTYLHNRYLLGVKIGHNSEGANYIAYDNAIGCKVLIREFMPAKHCKRVKGKAVISVYPDKVVNYKIMMTEFTHLNRNLAKMRNLPHINQTLDIFGENNTTYVVCEYLEGIKLVEYLNGNAGSLNWEQVSSLFPTFFTTLSLMHNLNMIHSAISPETIYITPKGELRLCGFSIQTIRVTNMDLPSEIYHGYGAPEQYMPGAKLQKYTDVYAVCAVLYRILTGSQPPDAPSRMEQDNLSEPHVLNPAIPCIVSNAIVKGMQLDAQKRTQSITELVTQLFEQEEERDATPDETGFSEATYTKAVKFKNEEKQRIASHVKQTDLPEQETILERVRMPLMFAIMLLCVLLIVLLIALSMMRSGSVTIQNQPTETEQATDLPTENNIVTESNAESQIPTESPGDSEMPPLIGTNYDVQKQKLEADGWLYLEPIYEYSDVYKAGVIIWQEIEAGHPFQSGSKIQVTVSQGPAAVIIPDYQDKTLMQYEEELEALGLTNANYYTEAVVNYQYATGQVVELNKAVGDVFDLSGQEMLRIFYASNPETTIVIVTETAPPETAAATEEIPQATTEALPPETAPPPESTSSQEGGMQEAPQTAPIDMLPFETAPLVQNEN